MEKDLESENDLRTELDSIVDDWEDLNKEYYINSFLGGNCPEHQKYLEEILLSVPEDGYWQFEDGDFKCLNSFSSKRVSDLIDRMAEEDETQLARPRNDNDKDYTSRMSYFIGALDQITPDNVIFKESEGSPPKYDISNFREPHLDTVKYLAEDY